MPGLPKSIFLPRMTSPTSEKDVEQKSIGKFFLFVWGDNL